MEKDAKIFVAGHKGMVGSAIVRKLQQDGFSNLLLRTSKELDLKNQAAVFDFFQKEAPDYVIMSAAKVGGIHASNTYKADFFYDNAIIALNTIEASRISNVKKLLFLGSSCVYPKLAPQPMKEEYLLSDYLEPTNESYSIAKIAGLKMCDYYREQFGCNFISVMPPNLYGPNDKYDLMNSHVIPSLIRKFHEAKENNKPYVELWGTGQAVREFMHSDDVADACLFLMDHYNERGHINIGVGEGVKIAELAAIVKEIVGYDGEIRYNTEFPDGTPLKVMDNSKITELGWKAGISLKQGLERTYREWLVERVS